MSPRPSPRIRGSELEAVALQYLTTQGLQMLQRNFQCRLGEIDLIMRERDTLVFVEVRYRRSARYGGAAETVDWRKQRKLIRTAQVYLSMHCRHHSPPCRFDILGIAPGAGSAGYHFDWLPNAFGLSDRPY